MFYFGHLSLDISEADLEIPKGVNVRLDFNLASPDFFLQAEEGLDCTYEMTQLSVWVPNGEKSSGLALKNEDRLAKETLKLYFRRKTVQNSSIPSGSTVHVSDNLYAAEVPIRVGIAFVLTKALTGTKHLTPYNLVYKLSDDCHVENIQLNINGSSIDGLPGRPEILYFKSFNYLGFDNATGTNGLTYPQFINGCFVCMYDLTTSLQSSMQTLGKSYTNLLLI